MPGKSILTDGTVNKTTSCIGSMGTWVVRWTTPFFPPRPTPQPPPLALLPLRHPAGEERGGSSRGSPGILRSCIEWHRSCIIYCFSGAAATLGSFLFRFFFIFRGICSPFFIFFLIIFFFQFPGFECNSLLSVVSYAGRSTSPWPSL